MSEFLKNFRTTHSRFSGNKRNPYDGHYYPAQERRNGSDRRNEQGQPQGKAPGSFYARIEELLPALQALLENIVENQQTLIDMKKARAEEEDSLLSVFRDIATSLQNIQVRPAQATRVAAAESRGPGAETPLITVEELEKTEMKSSADEKRDIIRIMKKLRKKGGTYKEIAQFLNENNVPTFSNKGHWHAQTIHRLCSR